MSKNSMTDIRLKQAEAKWTKAKKSGGAKAQANAKAELAQARSEWRQQGRPRPKDGDAAAQPASLKAQASDPKQGRT